MYFFFHVYLCVSISAIREYFEFGPRNGCGYINKFLSRWERWFTCCFYVIVVSVCVIICPILLLLLIKYVNFNYVFIFLKKNNIKCAQGYVWKAKICLTRVSINQLSLCVWHHTSPASFMPEIIASSHSSSPCHDEFLLRNDAKFNNKGSDIAEAIFEKLDIVSLIRLD